MHSDHLMMPPRKHSSSRASNNNKNNKLGDNKGHNNNNSRAQQQSAKRRRQLNENRSKAVPDIHSTVALLPSLAPAPSPYPSTTPFCPFLLQLNNFHSLSAGGQWTAASWQLFRVQQQIKFALVIGFQNTSTTAVFNAANSRRSFPHTHTDSRAHTHTGTERHPERHTRRFSTSWT